MCRFGQDIGLANVSIPILHTKRAIAVGTVRNSRLIGQYGENGKTSRLYMTGEQEQSVVDFHRNNDSRQDSRRTSQGDSVLFVVSFTICRADAHYGKE